MLRGLRFRLTLLYLLAALNLIILVGGGAYSLLRYYFQTTTDLALQHKMAHEFRQLGARIPPDLIAADRAWYLNRGRLIPLPPTDIAGESSDSSSIREMDDFNDDDSKKSEEEEYLEEAYDGELAAIFVFPMDAEGSILFDPNPFLPPMEPDPGAGLAALRQGQDWRTVNLTNGMRVRLFTYRLELEDGPALLQLGRSLGDQDRVLNELLAGLFLLGGASVLLLGAGSWWLAGRSLIPAQKAWEQQQTFVANASHELRTPLTLIRASTEVALRGMSESDEKRELLADVLEECDHMSKLVEDLLLLSRLDAGRLVLKREAIFLGDMLPEVQRHIGKLAGERGVCLVTNGVSGAVWGDPTRFRQVLLILLDNALRHTPPGGEISIATQPNGDQFQIIVTDTGEGIPPEHLSRLFDRFYQVNSARSGENAGSGLGLSIAKPLIKAQGGRIHISSQVGKGTRVTLTLPRVSK